MRELIKRTVALICAICMIVTGEIQPGLFVLAEIVNDLPTVLTQSVLTEEWDIYKIKVTYDDDAAIPDDAELVVSEVTEGNNPHYADYVAASAVLIGVVEENINLVKAFDIALRSKTTGEKYQPSKDLKVEISIPFYTLNDATPVEVVHFDDTSVVDAGSISSEPGRALSNADAPVDDGSEGTGADASDIDDEAGTVGAVIGQEDNAGTTGAIIDQVGNAGITGSVIGPDGEAGIDYSVIGIPTLMETELDGNTASFNTDAFSVYVVMQTIVRKTLENGDEINYLVKVEYDNGSGIPDNAVLEVAELDPESSEYAQYVQTAADTLGKEVRYFEYAYAFDINIVNPETGELYQPSKDVKVSIDLLGEDVNIGDAVDVVHLPGTHVLHPSEELDEGSAEEAKVLAAEVADGTVAFQSESFSVYVVTSDALMQHFVFLNDIDGGMNESNRRDYIYSEQVLVNGEKLIEAPKPSKNGAVFSHWSSTVGGDNTFVDDPDVDNDDVYGLSFSTVTINKSEIRTATAAKLGITDENQVTHDQMQAYMDEEKTVYLYAVYGAEKVLVKFYNQSGLVLKEVDLYKDASKAPAGTLSGSLDTTDDKYVYIPIQDKENTYIRFEYWTENSDTNINAGTITVQPTETRTQIELFPVLSEGHYIYFDSNKLKTNVSTSYISPIYIVNKIWKESDYTQGLSESEIAALTDDDIRLLKAKIMAKEIADGLWAQDDHGIPIAPGYVFEGWYLLSSGEGSPLFKVKSTNDGYDYNATELVKRLDNSGNLPNHPTVFAKWTKLDEAAYKIVVWKQMLNNAGTAAVDQYAFVESFNMPMHSVDPNEPAELPDAFLNLENMYSYMAVNSYRTTPITIQDNMKENPFYGFDVYIDNSPTAKYKTETSETVSPDGSTVLNVYYKRKNYMLTFVVNMTGSGYEVATSPSGTLYGMVNGQFVRVTYGGTSSETTATNTYYYTPTTSNTGTQYGIYNNTFIELDYYNSQWYRSTSHTSTNRYTGTRYIRSNADNSLYTGTRYTTPNCTTSTTSGSGTQYWKDGNTIYQLTVTTVSTNIYYYNGSNYYGTVFTSRSSGTYNRVVRIIDAPYGASVVRYFPITNQWSTNTKYEGYSWDPSPRNTFQEVLATIETMPGENVVFVGTKRNTSFTVKYYLEYSDAEEAAEISGVGVTGSTRTFTYDGVTKNYALYKEIKHSYNYITFGEEYHEIDGYIANRRYAEPFFGQRGKTVGGADLYNADMAPIGGRTTEPPTTEMDINYLFYQKNSYTLRFVDTSGVTGIMAPTMPSSVTVKFNDKMDVYKPTTDPTLRGYRFTGWYMDPTCTKQAFFTEAEYNAAVDFDGNALQDDQKELVDRMPSHSVDLYAGWEDVKFRVNVYPDGGEMGGSTEQPNNYSNWYNILYGEKVTEYKNITRDYIKAAGSGSYAYVVDPYGQTYDGEGNRYARSALYTETPENGEPLEYVPSPGAYVLLGWFEAAEFNSDGTPKKDADGQYITKDKPFSFGSAPNRDVTLIAKWQRAGGFYVRYDIKDPNLTGVNYERLQIPVDENEYIDGANALVLPAIDAPKGYALDYWVDKEGNHYQPNQLLPISDKLADQVGGALQLWLTAVYAPYVPSERVMADYTFMTNVAGTQTTVHNDVTGQDETVTGEPYVFASNYHAHEIQRIAVNEELKPPVTPESPDGYVFKGWYYDKEGSRRFDGFGVIATPTYTTIYAVYERIYKVNYFLTDALTNKKTEVVLATQTYSMSGTEKLDTRHVSHPVDNDHYIIDWTDGTAKYSYNRLTNTPVTRDMDLYAEVMVRKYIQFNSMGGSYVETQVIPEDGWPVYPQEPTRRGYSFLGWYAEPDGNNKYEFDKPLPTDASGNAISTLYAHWAANRSERGNLTIAWWAQTADRPEDVDADYADDPDYDINTDTAHYQLIAMRQDFTAPIDTYTKDKYDTSQANGGLGLMSGWNNIVTVLDWAKGQNITSAVNFLNNTVGAGGNVADVARYYEFNGAYAASVASSVTVDDSGDSILNVRFVLKTYTFQFNLTTNTNLKVNVHANNKNYTDTYTFKTWLGKDISLWWPIDDANRQAAGASASAGAWVEKTGGSSSFSGWSEVNGNKSNFGTMQPTADKEKIDVAYANGGIYKLNVNNTSNTGAGKLHYMEWNGEKYVEMTALSEDKKVATSSGNYHTMASSCGMDYLDLLLTKSITNYINVTDANGEPTKVLNGVSTRIDHNHIVSGQTRSYARYKTRSASQQYVMYDSVYTNTFNTYYQEYTFYGGLNVTYPAWDLLGLFPEYESSYPVNPVTDVTFIYDGDLKNEYATDGTPLDEYSRTENNLTVYSGTTNLTGKTMYYRDNTGKWYTMDWATFVSKVYPSTQKTYQYSKTVVGAAGYDFYFYYEPLEFILTLIDRGTQVTAMNVKYKAQLTGANGAMKDYLPEVYSPASETHPAPVGKTFVGWGVIDGLTDADQAYSTPDGKMPAYNVTLYAIWAPTYCGVITDGVDKNGSANGSPESALYTVKYGTRLKETQVPVTPNKEGEIFLGWQIKDANGEMRDVTMNYVVRESIVLYPKWMDLSTHRVIFHANGGKTDGEVKDEDKYVVDNNRYAYGTRVSILDGADKNAQGKRLALYVDRVDVNNHPYKGEFAYWNTKPDGSGQTYYANTVYIFQEGDTDANGNPIKELHLYAIYGEYRETTLYYNKNYATASFVLSSDESSPYTNKLINDSGNPHNGEVSVLYRDWMNTDWNSSFQKKPNDPFPLAEDEDGIDFTAVRTDSFGNTYALAGWADFASATVIIGRNGDTAYVNTIDEENTNTLYAVWAICKVVDMDGKEHMFDTIQKAVNFINNNGVVDGRQLGRISNKTDTVEMLIDYKTPENVNIPAGCNVTLTTAHDGTNYYHATKKATITRAMNGGSLFTTSGTFSTTNIILDGGAVFVDMDNDPDVEDFDISGLQSTSSGGLVNVADGSFTIDNGTTMRNSNANGNAAVPDATSGLRGGAVYVASGASLTVNGVPANPVIFEKCIAEASGGAIHASSSALTLNGSVAMSSTGTTKMYAIKFEHCLAQSGGAIEAYSQDTDSSTGTSLTIKGSSFTKCKAYHDGGAAVSTAHETVIDSCEMSKCFIENNVNARYGGAVALMNTAANSLVSMKGSTFSECANEYGDGKGGAVYVGGQIPLNMIESANTFLGCSAIYGGAIYVHEGATIILKDNSTINGNVASTAGAGIYLKEGAVMKLSGAPDFGGSGVGTSGNLIVETTGTGGDTVPAGNFVTLAGYSAKQNGQKNYHSTNKVRQDIVICEGHENDPQSLVVVGDLTGSPGTIWIWAERSYHYKQFMPFAVMDGVEFAEKENGTLPAGKLDAEHLQVFRNAQDDGKTDDGTGSWLYGTVEGETEGYVYWNGTSGIRKVILRKLDSTYSSVKDKSFTIYKATSTTAYLPKDQTTPLTGLTSLDSGIIFIGLLPYGWYIVEEDDPHRFFYIVVDGSGVYGTQETSPSGTLQNKIGGYDTREAAETEAIARYNALKAATP